MATKWPDTVDEILDGDRVMLLASATPARGIVATPVTNFGVRDREAGTLTPNTSVGAWKKIERIRRNPKVALAFHTRAHATHSRPEYVLVQGTATLSEPDPDYPSSILENWERVEDWSGTGRLWKRWLRIYALRVGIEIAAERVVVWPGLSCEGGPAVHGAPLPAEAPAPQPPPRGGTAPRLNHERAARKAARLPQLLLSWAGADGFPVSVPVEVAGTGQEGIELNAPAGLVPPGGRRAGLTAHWFNREVTGHNQRVYTGWLEAGPGARIVYAPHTYFGYRLPPSLTLFHLFSGAGTRWQYRQLQRQG
jgi:general stress protein 26